MILHATAVARATAEGWRGVLLRGPSGAGKSDLALRLIEHGWRLVGDDYVEVWGSGGGLFAAPAPRIAGVMEARGVGLIGAASLSLARLDLIVDCEPPSDRMPEPDAERIDGVSVARLSLAALEASTPWKIIAALHARDMASRLEP
jgi:serine kinase of HPr protein (carbohydrate metabolism regulator)